MRSFTHGTISTFSLLLNTIWVGDVQLWDSNVNTTIRKLWEDSYNLELGHLFAHGTVRMLISSLYLIFILVLYKHKLSQIDLRRHI